MTTKCSFCGLRYQSDYSHDVKVHKRVHATWLKVFPTLGDELYNLADYENLKWIYRSCMRNDKFYVDMRATIFLRYLHVQYCTDIWTCIKDSNESYEEFVKNAPTFHAYVDKYIHEYEHEETTEVIEHALAQLQKLVVK